MAFTLKVVFTGICAFVQNEREDADVKMCVVLPDGTPRAGADGSSLKRHRGFIQLKVGQIIDVPASLKGRDADVIWYLDHHRLTFDCAPGRTANLAMRDLSRIASLEHMVPGFAAPAPAITQADPPQTVLAQVLLHVGRLRPNLERGRLGRWAFQRSISFPSFEGDLTSEVVLEVPDLETVELTATPFAGGEPTTWKLKGDDAGEVVVVIANLCDENPLRWDVPEPRMEPDEDFRWYYTLLSNSLQSELLRRLNGLAFPIPVPSLAVPNGEGRNCVPARTAAASYNLDSFLPGRKGRSDLEPVQPETLMDEPALTVGGSSVVRRGSEYVAQIGPQASPAALTSRGRSRSDLQGEIGFRIVDVRGTYTEVELTRLSLFSSGITTQKGKTGKISVSGLSGRGSLVRTGDQRWSLEARVTAQVLYRAVEKEKGFREVVKGLYMPDFETFEGVVRADLADPEGDGEMITTAGALDLRWVAGGLNWVERLSIPLRNVVLSNWSAKSSTLAAADASKECPGTRRMRVQPYAFRNGNQQAHSGTSWDRQLQAAQKVWGGCCIQLDAQPLILLDRPGLQTSGDVNEIRGSVAEDDEQPDVIEIFLVDNALASQGGGATFSSTTSLARVVISNDNAGNLNLLAHELGHVFGGLHPQDPPQIGFWVADAGTVLHPSGSSNSENPSLNSRGNCRRIRNAALVSTGAGCCISV